MGFLVGDGGSYCQTVAVVRKRKGLITFGLSNLVSLEGQERPHLGENQEFCFGHVTSPPPHVTFRDIRQLEM